MRNVRFTIPERILPTGTDLRDYLFLGMTLFSLLVACAWLAIKRDYWHDELFSWYLLTDPSFSHMLQAFGDKINNTPSLYFVMGWSWAQVFGGSELSLRLFSSLGVCASLVLVWLTLRRYYDFWPVALGVLTVFCTADLILEQNAEARMYGLYLATAALTLVTYDRICQTLGPPSLGLLITNGLVHAALIHTHLHGAFYSGAILVAVVVYDKVGGNLRWRVYASIVLSWLTIILYIPAFLVQADAGRPRSWMPEPLWRDLMWLFSDYRAYYHPVALIILLLLAAIGGIVLKNRTDAAMPPARERAQDLHLLLFSMAMMAVPVGVWIISKFSRPIFFDRYLIPTALGITWLLTVGTRHLLPFISDMSALWRRPFKLRFDGAAALNLAVLIFCLVLVLNPILVAKNTEGTALGAEWKVPSGYEDLPLVFEASGHYHRHLFYSKNRERYYYVLDHEAASSPVSGQFGLQDYKHFDALRRQYPDYFRGQIIESDDFLDRFDRFLVLDYPRYDRPCPPMATGGLIDVPRFEELHCPQWLETRILNNPDYEVTELLMESWRSLLLVERVKNLK